MNIQTVLETIQEWRTQIDAWGITNETLIAVGVIALVLFMLSLREVACWFLKTTQTQDEIRALRLEITNLHKTLERTREMMAERATSSTVMVNEEVAEEAAETLQPQPPAKEETPAKRFTLDH